MTRLFYIIILSIFLVACGQAPGKKYTNTVTTTKGNISTTISTDTALLSNFIDITIFKPTSAKFKYVFIDNSGQKERLSVPGPSDYSLEAILYFDPLTFKKLQVKYFKADYTSQQVEKSNFNFAWLDDSIKKELDTSDTHYRSRPDLFLRLGPTGKLWFLDNKVLLTKTTN